MSDLTIRPSTSDDDARLLAIHNRIRSHMPPVGVEEYRRWYAHGAPEARLVRLVAELDGEVVAGADLRENIHFVQPGSFEGYLQVDDRFRRRGIGSRLYETVMAGGSQIGAGRVYVEVQAQDSDALAFAERRGFRRTGHVQRASRLDVHAADLTGFEGVEERLRREGIRIASLDELNVEDEAFMRDVMHVEHESALDIPNTEEQAAPELEVWVDEQLHGSGKSAHWFWVALDGKRPVGVGRLRLRGEHSATNGYTGVDRGYRGRGIARALKLRTIQWAREHDIDFLYTGNEAANNAILAINYSLGYQPLPEEIEFVKELEI